MSNSVVRSNHRRISSVVTPSRGTATLSQRPVLSTK
jgi:hypothetical protein